MHNAQDYGYFGKGNSGYAHYMAAYNRSFGSGGGGGGCGCLGCLHVLIIPCIVLAVVVIFTT